MRVPRSSAVIGALAIGVGLVAGPVSAQSPAASGAPAGSAVPQRTQEMRLAAIHDRPNFGVCYLLPKQPAAGVTEQPNDELGVPEEKSRPRIPPGIIFRVAPG